MALKVGRIGQNAWKNSNTPTAALDIHNKSPNGKLTRYYQKLACFINSSLIFIRI